MPFVADGEAVADEPGDGASDLPAVSAEKVAGVDAAAADARDDAAFAQPCPVGRGVVGFVGAEPGLRRRGPRRDRVAGRPWIIGCRAWLSWMWAAETPTSSGRPFASDSTCSLDPVLPRSTGFGPVSDPPLARTAAASRIAADQSISPFAPIRSSTARCSFGHNPASVHAVNRRCAVGMLTPNDGGKCRHAQPEVNTNTIAVNTARSSVTAVPPPCGLGRTAGISGLGFPQDREGFVMPLPVGQR